MNLPQFAVLGKNLHLFASIQKFLYVNFTLGLLNHLICAHACLFTGLRL